LKDSGFLNEKEAFAERLRTTGARKVFTPQRGAYIDLVAMSEK